MPSEEITCPFTINTEQNSFIILDLVHDSRYRVTALANRVAATSASDLSTISLTTPSPDYTPTVVSAARQLHAILTNMASGQSRLTVPIQLALQPLAFSLDQLPYRPNVQASNPAVSDEAV